MKEDALEQGKDTLQSLIDDALEAEKKARLAIMDELGIPADKVQEPA
jgi:hypothetical protein